MSICTGRGNDGFTGLLFGRWTEKEDLRVEVCGSIDELNSHIGVVRKAGAIAEVIAVLDKVQQHLVAVMGEVARLQEDHEKYVEKGYSRISEDDRSWLLSQITQIETGDDEKAIVFRGWARPGEKGSLGVAFLDVCRTVCRRAEREFWRWDKENHYLLHKRYLNHLSDFFWVLARQAEKDLEK
jgi:cob(I)alamin adenosyltransferase